MPAGDVTILDFNNSENLELFPFPQQTGSQLETQATNASICDSLGNLAFYFNGVNIMNADFEIMENGNGVNPGNYSDDHEDGYNRIQAGIALPFPDNSNLFYLFHIGFEYDFEFAIVANKLYHSIIDISANDGLGRVEEKNELISENSLFNRSGSLTATRHANGRDWWILLPEFNTNGYYRILLSPYGINAPEYQALGEEIESGLGQSVFSPDGSKYARNNLIGEAGGLDLLDIYDFDRCTGLLSNHQQLMYADSAWSGGVAISPNSRFLYVSHQDYVFQFDLEADDLEASRDTVAIYDGFESPFTTHFFMAQLAPDGKIYINSPNSVDVLHVIHEPNLKGDSCNFEQHGIDLPFLNTFSLPNYSYFNLGALEGSRCDSLVNANEQVFFENVFEIFPNPASGQVQLKMEQPLSKNGRFILYDNLGKIVFEKRILKGSVSEVFDFQGFVKGMYFYEIRERGLKVGAGKLVLIE